MPVRLIDSLASTAPLAEVFSDGSILQALLDFETALARVESRLGIIPAHAAEAIAAVANPSNFDIAQLSEKTLRAGTPSIPLVKALTQLVRGRDAEAANFVHWGATSQDASDSALALLLKRAQPIIESDLARAQSALHALSEKHKATTMLGRTLLQAAPPITFGLKTAGWFAAIRRGQQRLSSAFAAAFILQFGGAVGTLAALGAQGPRVAEELAIELGLTVPEAPWHAHRDRLAALMCACAVLTGSVGKIARDISLLMQNEVGEVAEPESEGRGGSSTMPHKRNPIGCTVIIAAAGRMPGLIASYLSTMVQEHERSIGGSQSEWPTVAAVIQSTGLAAASMAEISEGLTADPERMREHLEATRGAIYAEKATMLLAAKIGREEAHRLVQEATRRAGAQNRKLAQVLREMPEATKHLANSALDNLAVAEDYLGAAEYFRQRLLHKSDTAIKKD